MSFIYVSSPYSDPNPEVRQERYEKVSAFIARITKQHLLVYCPIAHWHPIAVKESLNVDYRHWKSQNIPMLRACDSMFVLKLDGWDRSLGVSYEIGFAEARGIQVNYFDDHDYS